MRKRKKRQRRSRRLKGLAGGRSYQAWSRRAENTMLPREDQEPSKQLILPVRHSRIVKNRSIAWLQIRNIAPKQFEASLLQVAWQPSARFPPRRDLRRISVSPAAV